MISKPVIWPNKIILIGGGRWARVILESLYAIVPTGVVTYVHSPSNELGMRDWCEAKGLHHVTVSKNYPDVKTSENCAVIIANAAKNHKKAILWALEKKFPVMVEKPVTTSFYDTFLMGEIADKNNVILAAANVFLFSQGVYNFCKIVSTKKFLKSIKISWIDGKSEKRGGEVKSFDPALPVYADCLPHVVSIISMISSEKIKFLSLKLSSGGAQIVIYAKLGSIPCEIQLFRNASHRKRFVEVETSTEKLSVDFKDDPGIVSVNNQIIENNEIAGSTLRPVSSMLAAFIGSLNNSTPDKRLHLDVAKKANRIIDSIHPFYDIELSLWLEKELKILNHCEHEHLKYALCEIICKRDDKCQMQLNTKLEYLIKRLENISDKGFLFKYPKSALNLIEKLVEDGVHASYAL